MTRKWIEMASVFSQECTGALTCTDICVPLGRKNICNHVPCTSYINSWTLKYQSRVGGSCSISEHLRKSGSGMTSWPLRKFIKGPWPKQTLDDNWHSLKTNQVLHCRPGRPQFHKLKMNPSNGWALVWTRLLIHNTAPPPLLGMSYSEENHLSQSAQIYVIQMLS